MKCTTGFNWDQYASWENDVNFPTSMNNECQSEENYGWSTEYGRFFIY